MKAVGAGRDPAVTDLPLAVLHPSLFQRLLSEFLIFLELPPSSPSGCLSFPASPARPPVLSQLKQGDLEDGGQVESKFLRHPPDHWGWWRWHPMRVCCAGGKAVGEGLGSGALGILPSLSPSPPQQEAQALRLPPTEFQPRGGALRSAAPGGEPCLGRWTSKPVQPQGGTRGGKGGPSAHTWSSSPIKAVAAPARRAPGSARLA